jgi:hypothetical protein
LLGKLPEPVVIVALDVAEHAMVAAFAGTDAGVASTVTLSAPRPEATPLIRWLARFRGPGIAAARSRARMASAVKELARRVPGATTGLRPAST